MTIAWIRCFITEFYPKMTKNINFLVKIQQGCEVTSLELLLQTIGCFFINSLPPYFPSDYLFLRVIFLWIRNTIDLIASERTRREGNREGNLRGKSLLKLLLWGKKSRDPEGRRIFPLSSRSFTSSKTVWETRVTVPLLCLKKLGWSL